MLVKLTLACLFSCHPPCRLLLSPPLIMVPGAMQSAMPSAQNLVLLMQLRKSTQPLAPRMAALLLRIYAVAVIPVPAWITVFMSQPSMQALLV